MRSALCAGLALVATLAVGHSIDDPAEAGAVIWHSALLSPAEPVPGLHVSLVPGQPPALLVENGSGEELTVFDPAGAPFLRIGPAGVRLNRASALAGKLATPGRAGWLALSPTTRHAWLEPRALPGHGSAAHRWTVPMQLGARRLDVVGESKPLVP